MTMPLIIQHFIVLFCVALAAVFLLWRFVHSATQKQSGCHCGPEKGCLKMMETMKELNKER